MTLRQSLVKTLAAKHKCSVSSVLKKYKTTVEIDGRRYTVFRVVKQRPGKKPLTAEFGGFPLEETLDHLLTLGECLVTSLPLKPMLDFRLGLAGPRELEPIATWACIW